MEVGGEREVIVVTIGGILVPVRGLVELVLVVQDLVQKWKGLVTSGVTVGCRNK